METRMSLYESLKPVPIMKTYVTPFHSTEHAVRCISDRIANGGRAFCVAMNAAKLHYAGHRPDVVGALSAADFWLCDGVGAVLAARLLRGRKVRRCTDGFLDALMVEAERKGWGVFLLGASPKSNEGAADTVRRRFPRLRLVGQRDGYFESSDDVIRVVNESEALVLVVALGSPQQELWVAEHLNALKPCCIVTVGGALDVLSGNARRAPSVFRKTGTEFLYRLFAEPSRGRWARQLEVCAAALDVVKEYARMRLGRKQANEDAGVSRVSG